VEQEGGGRGSGERVTGPRLPLTSRRPHA
jgi:hypothetical protein